MLNVNQNINVSDRKEFHLPLGNDRYEQVTMFCQNLPGGLMWKFDTNSIPRKEIQFFILGSLIQDAFMNGFSPIIKLDQRKTVKDLNLPILFVNEPKEVKE